MDDRRTAPVGSCGSHQDDRHLACAIQAPEQEPSLAAVATGSGYGFPTRGVWVR